MKTLLSYARLSLTLGAISCFSILSPAAAPAASGDTTAAKTDQVTVAQSATDAPSVAANATVKLPYGVDDVLKLSRAKVNEDIIQSYIQNSGTIYNLGPNDIVYLRDQGVSDRVLNAMLDQRKKALE